MEHEKPDVAAKNVVLYQFASVVLAAKPFGRADNPQQPCDLPYYLSADLLNSSYTPRDVESKTHCIVTAPRLGPR